MQSPGGKLNKFKHAGNACPKIGARGKIAEGWTYDVYGLYGTTEYALTYLNDFSIRRGGNALIAVRNASGAIVCSTCTIARRWRRR